MSHVALSVRICVFVITVSPAEAVEPIEIGYCLGGAESRGPEELHIGWDTYGRHLVNTIERSALGGEVGCRYTCYHYCSNLFSVH